MRDPSVRQTAMIALAIVMIAVPQLPEQDLDEAVLSMQTLVSQKAHVSDCTIVNGDHGTKFAVWRITVFLEPQLEGFCGQEGKL